MDSNSKFLTEKERACCPPKIEKDIRGLSCRNPKVEDISMDYRVEERRKTISMDYLLVFGIEFSIGYFSTSPYWLVKDLI